MIFFAGRCPMKRFHLQISLLVLLLIYRPAHAQTKYPLQVRGVDRDSAAILSQAGLQTVFASQAECVIYLDKLPGMLQAQGFVTASLDSIFFRPDFARCVLFLGERYHWAILDARRVETPLLDAAGWNERQFSGKPVDFGQVHNLEQKMLAELENTGYPFARISLDSLQLINDSVSALLKVLKGPLYKVDSIRVIGNTKVSSNFLQRYLDIPNGSIYNRSKLLTVDKKLDELSYTEKQKPSDVSLMGTGAVLNLYLKQKKSSRFNALIGFLPNNDQLASKKLLVTGEADILLNNLLGAGETFGLNWQQLQVKSPRLNLRYRHPYIFRSPVSLDFAFDMFKKDSSYLNIDFQLAAGLHPRNNQEGRVFLQYFQTILSSGAINPQQVIQTKQLPPQADISSANAGIDYYFNNTNYRLNPHSGNEWQVTVSAGTKKIKPNNEILSLKDTANPSYNFSSLYDTLKRAVYQFRLILAAAHYFPLDAKRNTLKTSLHAGIYQSAHIFRNELFQVGGYKLLRGFDEESQYLSQYVVATIEYHYLVGRNSYFYALTDAGWGKNTIPQLEKSFTYISGGLGLAFETKAGIFNIAWAAGKRNDLPFSLRQSKIHIGFINYF